MLRHVTLPQGFFLGAASSAWQTEGWNGKKDTQDSYMDLWYKNHKSAWHNGYGPAVATNFHDRYQEDVDLMKQIGLQCYRTSLNWARFLTDYENVVVDEEYAAYFEKMIDACRAAGVEPMICLEHYELPGELFTKYGGWGSKHVVDLFVRYAEAAFQRFGSKVRYWFAFNEPVVVQTRVYLDSERWPFEQNSQKWMDWNYNKALATNRVMKLFKEGGYRQPGGKFGTMPIENPLLCEVQKHYSLAYALAEQAAIPLHRHYGRNVSEDEIGFLAYIFQLTLEQERKGFEKKNVLVVCSSGGASSRLIAYRFEEEFSKYLDNIEVCDVFHLEQYDFSKIDYIFSTVPIHQKVNVPIIRVEDFLNQSSMRVVQSILEGSSADFLSAYYQPELFFPHVEGRTKEEAIFNLCTQIDRVMSLPQGFYSAVLKREELARTDFCPLVAFPHAYKVLSEKTFVAVGILDEPIRWVENDVQVLLLISIADGEHPELQKFYLSITSFMQDTARVKSLIQCRDYPWFMRLLCGENGGSRENNTQKQNSKTQKEYESL